MKRVVLLLTLTIFGAAAISVAVPYYHRAQETARWQASYKAYAHKMGYDKPLAMDAQTTAILDGADRVETFRLQGGDEDENVSGKLAAAYASPKYLEDHFVIGNGVAQGRTFAGALHAALVQGNSEPDNAQCFMPGVGFRAWKGAAHTDICVCFTCQGVEVVTRDAKQTVLYQSLTLLGASRPALLTLSRQAFPQDKQLAAVPDQL